MPDDEIVIFEAYSDRFPAETLVKFLSAAGIPCSIVDPQPLQNESYGVCVPHRLLEEIRRLIDWTSVAEYADAISAVVVSGQLASADIPSTVASGGGRVPGPFNVYVPKRLRSDAEGVIAEPALSDAELTQQALESPVEDSDTK